MKNTMIIKDINNNIHKVNSYEELAKIIRIDQHILILNSKLERIKKVYIEFVIVWSRVKELKVY